MAGKKSRKYRVLTILGSITLFLAVLFFLLRGPYLSNSIKRILIPVLENATRERIIIDKAVINLFPFYVQAKGFKLFDKDGNRLLWITKSRAYIDLLGLLSREIRIRKLTLNEPDLTLNEEDLQRIMENLKKSYLVEEEGKYRVSLKSIQLTDGNVSYKSTGQVSSISGSSLYLDMVPKGTSYTITVLLKKGTLKLANRSRLEGSFDGKITVKDKRIEVTELNLSSSGSSFSTDGEILLSDKGKIEDGSLSVKTKISETMIHQIFPLKQKKDGMLSFEGFVRLIKSEDSEWPGFALDLKTDSRFYLETLMEILKVDHNITGELSVKGKITGTFPDIFGEGNAKLENAWLATLPLDDVEGELTYKDKRFALHGFKAHTYKGLIEGDGHIIIPSGNYMADAHIDGLDSPQFFKFINWDSPFPQGKISGDVKLYHEKGHDIEVVADVNYRNTSPREGDVLDRLNSAYTSLELRDNVLWLDDTVLSTDRTNLYLDGSIDINKETLALNLKLNSQDAADLTAPYYTKLSAPVRFEGTAAGPAKAPVITGKAAAEDGTVHGVNFTKASADLKYRINSLLIDRLLISHNDAEYDLSGTIDFREAEGLFSFKAPYYKGRAELRNADIRPFVKEAYKEIPVSGRVSGKVSFEGDSDKFISPGEMSLSNADIYGQQLDRVTVKYELRPKEIEFKSVKAYRAKSNLEAKGTLFFNKKYDVTILSDKVRLHDLSYFKDYPLDMVFGLAINGTGSIDNPSMKFSANIDDSSLKGVHVGKGEITGTLNNHKLLAKGSLIDGLITAEGDAVLSDKMNWNINSKIREGRYDFLLKGFMKEVPEDLQLRLEGTVRAEGQGDKISIYSKFNSAAASLYGFDLKNREDINIELINDELRVKSFSMAGNNVDDLSAAGTVKLYGSYNMHIRGNMEIAPFRALSDKIVSLRGMGSFEIDVSGAWKKPEVYGEISLSDAAASVTELPYKIGPVNGTFYLQRDRFTFDSVHSKFAGGTIDMSGSGYLDGLSLKRLFLTADVNGIRIRPAEGLSAELGGQLFYDTSLKGSSLTGNVDIRKARYTKRIEWKSWLLGLKGVNQQVTYPAFLKDTAINVIIRGDDNIIIDNNIARTPVKIALNLTGTAAQKGLLGKIEANEGTVYFRSREFNILEGSSVDFVDPYSISPLFHIVADTYIGDYYIKLNLDGTMDNFTVAFYSDPPLSETDTLALLATGQTSREGTGIEGGVAAGEAASLLTGGIQDSVEEEFQYYTGIDRFEIEPHTTTEGSFVPRATIGKRLFENKLYVTYSTAIGTTEENIIKLEYKIDKNISLVGSRNEIGSAGVDLKYRFEFR